MGLKIGFGGICVDASSTIFTRATTNIGGIVSQPLLGEPVFEEISSRDLDFLEDYVAALSVYSILEGLGEVDADLSMLVQSLTNKYIYLLHPLPYYSDIIEWAGRIKPARLEEIFTEYGEDEIYELLGKVIIYKELFDQNSIDNLSVRDLCESVESFMRAARVEPPEWGGELRERAYRCITAVGVLLSKIVFG